MSTTSRTDKQMRMQADAQALAQDLTPSSLDTHDHKDGAVTKLETYIQRETETETETQRDRDRESEERGRGRTRESGHPL